MSKNGLKLRLPDMGRAAHRRDADTSLSSSTSSIPAIPSVSISPSSTMSHVHRPSNARRGHHHASKNADKTNPKVTQLKEMFPDWSQDGQALVITLRRPLLTIFHRHRIYPG